MGSAGVSILDASLAVPAAVRETPGPRLPGIQVRGVFHRYAGQTDPVQALETIDLDIAVGAFVAILGPSGCGKTTLLRILSGLLEPSGGEVRLDGDTSAAARRHRAIGWLAQEDGLLPWHSVADNVRLPLRLAGERRSGVELELLRRVGLEGSARQYPHELSGGMRQRVALARALVARPPYLLLDEPFAHLDELTRERLGDLLLELRAEVSTPPTTVLVTHSVLESVRLADHVVVMSARPGRVLVDIQVELERPRHEDQPGFGSVMRRLKTALSGAHFELPNRAANQSRGTRASGSNAIPLQAGDERSPRVARRSQPDASTGMAWHCEADFPHSVLSEEDRLHPRGRRHLPIQDLDASSNGEAGQGHSGQASGAAEPRPSNVPSDVAGQGNVDALTGTPSLTDGGARGGPGERGAA